MYSCVLHLCRASFTFHFMKEPRQLLAEILSERIASRPSYSLRAFARDLEISPQQLSNVLNGRRGISVKMALQLSKKLGFSSTEMELFCETTQATYSRSSLRRNVAQEKIAQMSDLAGNARNLEMDLFKVISNWYYFALVELIKVSKVKKNPASWFSKKLDISENEILNCLSRLERLKLIKRVGATWQANQDTVVFEQKVPNEAVRNFHRQVLEKAIQALSFQNPDERYGSSSVVPIQVKNLDKAKKLIQTFRLKFAKEISDSKNGEEIYGLSMQFFRLSQVQQIKPENKKESKQEG